LTSSRTRVRWVRRLSWHATGEKNDRPAGLDGIASQQWRCTAALRGWATLARTARSRLPGAIEHVLRSPIVTAHTLAGSLSVTPEAALGLLRQLIAAGVAREATGRAAWRAFTTV